MKTSISKHRPSRATMGMLLGQFLAAAMMGGLFFGLVWPAQPHEAPMGWSYGWECCSSMDCREISHDAIEETETGYLVKSSGELIPYGDKRIKQSKDEFYHLCTRLGGDDTPVICLYQPMRGF